MKETDVWDDLRTAAMERAIRRDRYCRACGSRIGLSAHHINPRANGGSDDQRNLITLCHACHDKVEEMGEYGWAWLQSRVRGELDTDSKAEDSRALRFQPAKPTTAPPPVLSSPEPEPQEPPKKPKDFQERRTVSTGTSSCRWCHKDTWYVYSGHNRCACGQYLWIKRLTDNSGTHFRYVQGRALPPGYRGWAIITE